MKRYLGISGLALAVAGVVLTATPAQAVPTGSWQDGVLTVRAQPGDTDVVVDARENHYDQETTVSWVEVYGTPVTDLGQACARRESPPYAAPHWYCPGAVSRMVLDGGAARADLNAQFSDDGGIAALTAGSEGGTMRTNATQARVRGKGGQDVLTYVPGNGSQLRGTLAGGDDRVEIGTGGWSDEALRNTWVNVGLGSGDDSALLTTRFGRAVMFIGAAGDDDVTAAGRVSFRGGRGNDRLRSDADDVRSVFNPQDELPPAQPNSGDRFRGGAGVDTVVVGTAAREGGVRITLDDRANDGAEGERDNYGSDVESVVIRFVRARVVGGDAVNRIVLKAAGTAFGGGGDDVLRGGTRLVGGPGHDSLAGSPATLRIDAADGSRDQVRCAVGGTLVRVDAQDVVTGHCRVVVA